MTSEPFWTFYINRDLKESIIVELKQHQEDAIEAIDHGKILYGGVGSGKTRTILVWYMKKEAPKDLYVITTAKKRDTMDWEGEAAQLGISTNRELSRAGKLTVDSWNNLGKYTDVEDAFFIFDEQRVVGSGEWANNFLKVTTKNRWVLLSATPGDTWLDYVPVFIANGFYRNRQEFLDQHVVYERFVKYPKVKLYLGTNKLNRLRNEVLVEMKDDRPDKREINWLSVGYDTERFNQVWQKRWNVFDNKPIKDAAELFRVARRVLNTDPSRLEQIEMLAKCHDKIVVFYRYDHELEQLRLLADGRLCGCAEKICGCIAVAELNGHKHDPLPMSERWIYLVQYTAGSEGWNCTETNAMVFFSLPPSYRQLEQAMGRIDRMDTPFQTLYYYLLVSDAVPDRANKRRLQLKKRFNEVQFVKRTHPGMT